MNAIIASILTSVRFHHMTSKNPFDFGINLSIRAKWMLIPEYSASVDESRSRAKVSVRFMVIGA